MSKTSHSQNSVIIIGAGLAGVLASFWLSKYKVKHLLLDAKTFPRDKACADVITSNAIRRLNEIDPEIIKELKTQGFLKPIKGTVVYPPNNKSLRVNFKWLNGQEGVDSCYSIQRHALDYFLIQRAKSSKYATVLTHFRIEKMERNNNQTTLYVNNGQKLTSPLVIVATGSNSNLTAQFAPQLKSNKHTAVGIRAYFKGITVKEGFGELLLKKELMPGGFYLTSMENGLTNVNLVLRKDQLQQHQINLKTVFETLVAENPLLKEKFKNAQQISPFKGSALKLATTSRKRSGNGFMLIGDAAGLIDLISANGIPQAMLSGKLAAKQALDCLEANNYSERFMKRYDKSLQKQIKSDVALGRFLNPFLGLSWVKIIILKSLNLLATNSENESVLTQLFYSKNPVLNFINPQFYWRLIKEGRETTD